METKIWSFKWDLTWGFDMICIFEADLRNQNWHNASETIYELKRYWKWCLLLVYFSYRISRRVIGQHRSLMEQAQPYKLLWWLQEAPWIHIELSISLSKSRASTYLLWLRHSLICVIIFVLLSVQHSANCVANCVLHLCNLVIFNMAVGLFLISFLMVVEWEG